MKKRLIKPWPFLLILLIIVSLLVEAQPAQASQQPGITMTVEAGFDGNYKEGCWIPIRVVIENNGPSVDAQVETSIEAMAGNRITYAYPVELPSQSRKEVFLHVYPDGYLTQLTITLMSGKDQLASAIAPLTSLTANDLLFGVVASSTSPYNVLSELDPSQGAATVAELAVANLPDRVQAWQALDVLVIADVDSGTLSTNQRQALAAWVANGGQLLVAGGPGWQKTAAGLSDLLPLIPTGTQNLSGLGALQAYSIEPMEDAGQVVAASGSLTAQAEVLVAQDGLPLVVRRLLGQGQVIYLSADPGLKPLKNWDGMSSFYQDLFSAMPDQPGWANGFINWSTAEEASNSLPGLALPSLVLICCFLGVYVLVLGPINYLVLRYLKRAELAWVSIPVLVVFFSGLAFLIGSLSRGNQPVINQMAVVQVWPDAPQAIVHGLAGVYSPRRGTYEARINGQYLASSIPSSYTMADRSGTFLQSEQQILMPDFRIDVGGIRALMMEGSIPAPAFANGLALTIDEHGVVLNGIITNHSDLELKDAVLMYPGGSLAIGEFGPGDSYEVNLPLVKSQLVGAPTLATIMPSLGIYTTTPYYSYYGYDDTLTDIVGTSSYYDDYSAYQRYLLTSAVLSTYSDTNGRGGGIYLSGWNDKSPLEVGIVNRSVRTSDTTLYLVSLMPRLDLAGDTLRLSPGMFTWRPLGNTDTGQANPYNGYLYQGYSSSIQYALSMPVHYSRVRSLIINLGSPSGTTGSPTEAEFQLWDYTTEQWVDLSDPGWGSHQIENPERYVSPSGAIQLSISNPNLQWIDFNVCDFTLEVEP